MNDGAIPFLRQTVLKRSAPQSSLQRQSLAFTSSQLNGEASSDRQFLEQSAPQSSLQQHSSSQLHRAISSFKQLGRYSNNGVLITEAKAISLSTRIFFSQSTGMGVVYYHIMRSLAQAAGPEWNRMETEWKYTGGVQVIEWQTAELAFCFNGTEWKGNVNVFMSPTIA